MPYQQTVDLSQVSKLKFWKKKDHIQILQRQIEVAEEMVLPEEREELIKISSLPNCTRVCINVILLPEWCLQVKNNYKAKGK